MKQKNGISGCTEPVCMMLSRLWLPWVTAGDVDTRLQRGTILLTPWSFLHLIAAEEEPRQKRSRDSTSPGRETLIRKINIAMFIRYNIAIVWVVSQ